MRFAIQLGLVLVGVAALGVALAFLRGVPAVVDLWPYSTAYGLTTVFIASMFAAIGAPIVWIGLSGDLAAIRPGGINIIAVGVGLAGQATWKVGFEASTNELMIFAIVVWAIVVAVGVMMVLARNEKWRDPRPWASCSSERPLISSTGSWSRSGAMPRGSSSGSWRMTLC
jgi:hypothetical protein